MSSGGFITAGYEADTGTIYPVRIQPETLTLTLNEVANAAPSTAIAAGVPSARVSAGRRSLGVNCRLVRVRTPVTGGDANYVPLGILSLPVLTQVAYASYTKGQTGTYQINGTAIPVAFVGKTPETIL